MSKEKFNWKKLFIQTEETQDEVIEKKAESEQTITFPSNHPKNQINGIVDEEILNKIIGMYESGFEKMNVPGFDFFEFFNSVVATGSGNPQTYTMAFNMAKGLDKSVSKEKLLKGADFYLEEIQKVYKSYVSEGTALRNELITSKQSQTAELQKQISELESQIAKLQQELDSKKKGQQDNDPAWLNRLNEIEAKLKANDIAKDKLVSGIELVVTGIKNNL